MKTKLFPLIASTVAFCFVSQYTLAADALKLTSPLPRQVVQREGFEPARAWEHERGGPQLGYGILPIVAQGPETLQGTWQYRVVPLKGAFGSGSDWAPLAVKQSGKTYTASAKTPAGGWYRLEIRVTAGEKSVASAAVEPVGVGEIFLIAGQSYATGSNEEPLKVDDPQGRVVAYDTVKNTWNVANDPQPDPDPRVRHSKVGGTIWPAMGNALLPLVHVPIGFVNVAAGGTASRQWMPGEDLYKRAADSGKRVGRFRAVLWQQGESDVIEKVDTETYVKHLLAIRAGLVKEWGFEPPWFAAKSTIHPMVYIRPDDEAKIRAAIDRLCHLPGFRPGPDTDILGGENRADNDHGRHFSAIGQRRAALMWFNIVWDEINREEPRK